MDGVHKKAVRGWGLCVKISEETAFQAEGTAWNSLEAGEGLRVQCGRSWGSWSHFHWQNELSEMHLLPHSHLLDEGAAAGEKGNETKR